MIYMVQSTDVGLHFVAKITEDAAMNYKEHQILSILNTDKF